MTRRMQLLADGGVIILFAWLTANVLGIAALNSTNTPTGGDAASHLLYAWKYAEGLFFSGMILPWMPEVFAGFPFLSYYFPLPFIVIAFLSKVIGFVPAFKWGSFAAALLLPGAVHLAGRRWLALPWPAAFLGALGAFAFLLHEQNSIWGGNLLSILSGEFAYSYGLLFAVLACLAWSRASSVRGGWVVAALLEAASGFSHGFTLLVVGFSTILLLIECSNLRRTIWMLIRGHLLAFCLLGGWLWPMLEMHGYTIPNDAVFPLTGWNDLLPLSLRPVFAAGLAALAAYLLSDRLRTQITPLQSRAMRYLAGCGTVAALGFFAGDQIGLANIRFFPILWLFAAIISGWLSGSAISGMVSSGSRVAIAARTLLSLALALGMVGWLAQNVHSVPDWSLWNHAGLESKPQWHNLTKLFPSMKGSLWSPRLVFEHAPANEDLGSTRTLEALPMFIGRPVLEGLYMESALIGPAVYQLQSEISAQPSSPLARFPSGTLDPSLAAEHMRFLHADTLLLRSNGAKAALEKCGLFEKIAESHPFAVYRLREFSSQLAEVITQPTKNKPLKNWMDGSFSWFRTRSLFSSSIPVYGAEHKLTASPTASKVTEIKLERHHLHFQTNAIGKPHLIKVSWHPRWKLLSAGKLYIAGPGFMLVVPEERNIILEFGHTQIGLAGMTATAASILICLFLFMQIANRTGGVPVDQFIQPTNKNRSVLFFISLMAIVISCFWFASQSPEKTYKLAFEAMYAGHNAEAAKLFQRAYERRRPPAKKEEALFWLAKNEELAGHKEEAMKRYVELADNYHGNWVPEALYTYVHLGRSFGERITIESYATRLQEEYPNSIWTSKLKEIK